jgi:Kef-type K+ transport system membrane component KefB
MTMLALILLGAALGLAVSRWLGLPAIPLLILGGVALSATGLLPPGEMLGNALVLGLSFLLFAAGTELNPQRVSRYRKIALQVGLAQFFVLWAAGFVAAILLGYETIPSLYLALALTASSTLVVVRLLQQRRQMFEPFGRMVVGVLLLQDLLIVSILPFLTRLPLGTFFALKGFALTLLLVAAAYLLQKWVMPFLFARIRPEPESMLLAILSLLFVFIGAAYLFQLPLVTGAFLAGVSLSGFPVNSLVREQLHSLSDFFTSVFFTVLGAMITIPDLWTVLSVAACVLVVVLLTPPVVAYVAERGGLSARSSLEGGLLLSQTSEFSLVVGLEALMLGYVGQGVFSAIVLVTVITMVTTPFMATGRVVWKLLRLHPSRVRERPPVAPTGHILLIGCGDSGMPLLETLHLAGYPTFVIDDDPVIIAYLKQNDVPCIQGDGSDLRILKAAGASHARVIVSTIRRAKDNRALLRSVKNVPVLVRVITEEDARMIEAYGGVPISYAEAAVESFLHWFRKFQSVPVMLEN